MVAATKVMVFCNVLPCNLHLQGTRLSALTYPKMDAVDSSETFVFIYQTTWCCIPEYCNSELNCVHHIKLLQNY